ncbi:MAG: hypothetical protein V1838_05740 [Patescibacteria group bacterium]
MAKNIPKSQLSLIKSEERTPDGNLLPEVRERILREIKIHLQQTGYLNVSEISSKIGLSRHTTRKLVEEIAQAWRDELQNQFMVQVKWYQGVFKDIRERPETFSKEKFQLIQLQSSLLSKVNSLMKVLIIK